MSCKFDIKITDRVPNSSRTAHYLVFWTLCIINYWLLKSNRVLKGLFFQHHYFDRETTRNNGVSEFQYNITSCFGLSLNSNFNSKNKSECSKPCTFYVQNNNKKHGKKSPHSFSRQQNGYSCKSITFYLDKLVVSSPKYIFLELRVKNPKEMA